MRIGYADPPYLGMGKRYAHLHPEARIWDDPESHRQLIQRLSAEFDVWALSASSPSLWTILPMCPPSVRVMAWVKPFCSFKPGVNPAYAWEPVILGGTTRKRARTEPTVRDFVSANITLKKGLCGVKPPAFWVWLFAVLGAQSSDTFVDLFPGLGAGGVAWEQFRMAA